MSLRPARLLAAGLVLLAAAPTAAPAQSLPEPQVRAVVAPASPSSGRVLTGALVGGAAGALVGGLVGGTVGGNWCVDPGNPDSCRGLAGVVTGAAVGFTVGSPVGAHLGNRRRGKLAPSLLASTALAVAGAVAFRQADVHVRGAARAATLNGIIVGVPVLQAVSAMLIETRTSR